MSRRYLVTLKAETQVELTVELVAQWFCELDDEAQADFFIAIARTAENWRNDNGRRIDPGHQWYLVGRHLVNCACGTPEALSLVEELSNGIRAARSQRPL